MFIVLDIETTGLSPKDDAIIEVACVKIDRKTFQEVGRFTSFVNPQRDIPELITGITHISKKDVASAPIFSEIADDIQDFIEGYPIIGHNINFDLRFLEFSGIDISKNPPIDTFFLANFLCSDLKSLNLGYLCESFGIDLLQAHRAIDDTLATCELFVKLVIKLQSLSQERRDIAFFYFSQSQDVGVRILRDSYLQVPKKILNYTDISEYYVKKLKKNIYDIQDISQSHSSINLEDFLSKIPNFELRENQRKMLDKVDKTFSQGEKVLIEAPTGIGKTFAYLLPAISYSLRTGEAVHISTSTKALQDQIYYKDLSLIQSYFPEVFSYTKLKGKRNYLCVTAFLEFIDITSYTSSQKISFLLKVLFWSMESEFGELDDLDYYGEEYSFLSEIHAGGYNIFDESLTLKNIEFVVLARKRAKSSHIVICNNHILFQDIISEGSLLGGVKNLVLDEAHSLEDVVTQSLKKTLSFLVVQQIFQKIDAKLAKHKVDTSLIMTAKQQILYDVAELFSLFEGSIFEKFSSDARYKTMLLDQNYFSEYETFSLLAKKICEHIKDIKTIFTSYDLQLTLELQELFFIEELLLQTCIYTDTSKYIYFLSYEDQKGTQLSYTLLQPGQFLQEYLWSKLESVVLTSATLQMEGDFSYIQNTLQVDEFQTLVLPSDFDYSTQALVYIPQDIGSIKNNTTLIINFLQDFFLTVRGRTLVLFTAFFMIREVFSQLKVSLEEQNIHLYAQSIGGSKLKQIESFQKHPENSILLGTDTFWEGIDIAGEDLQYLIIHKIPFQVPTDPIFIARSSLYKDSFSQYAIPKSLLKLKQGFGRLIRTKKDKGIIVFLDDRIFSTSWGKRYLEAFPKDIKIIYGKSQNLLEILKNKQ